MNINQELENAHVDYEKRKLSTLYDLSILDKALYYYHLEGKISREAYKSFQQVIKSTMKLIKEREI